MDIFDDKGNKIAHLLPYLPSVKDGDIILVKLGKAFGLTVEERTKIADVIYARANKRVKVVVVDESSTIEVTTPAGFKSARSK